MALREFLKSIADAIRGKEGSSGEIPAAQFASRISAIQTGVTLPTLTDPAGDNDVRLDKEYIGADGKRQYGLLNMDGVWTPDWSAFVPISIGYDSGDRYLVMDNLDGVGGGQNLSSFYVKYPAGETLRYFFDPSVCYDWNSFIASEYNAGRFEAGTNPEGNYCVLTKWDEYGYIWYIRDTEWNLDAPILADAVYTCTYWVP